MATPDARRRALRSLPDRQVDGRAEQRTGIRAGRGRDHRRVRPHRVRQSPSVRLVRSEPAEVVGQSSELRLPERFRARHIDHSRRYTEHLRIRRVGSDLDLFARRNDGSESPFEISLSSLAGEHPLVAAAIRDVTDRKHVETSSQRRSKPACDASTRRPCTRGDLGNILVMGDTSSAPRELHHDARLRLGVISEDPEVSGSPLRARAAPHPSTANVITSTTSVESTSNVGSTSEAKRNASTLSPSGPSD